MTRFSSTWPGFVEKDTKVLLSCGDADIIVVLKAMLCCFPYVRHVIESNILQRRVLEDTFFEVPVSSLAGRSVASPFSSTVSSSPGGASLRAAATKFQSSGAPWKNPCSTWPRHMAVSETETLSTWGHISRHNMAVMSSVFFESIAGDSITER